MRVEELIRASVGRAATVRVRNALNPMLWLAAVMTPTLLLFAWLLEGDPFLKYALCTLASLPVLTALVAYSYFMLADPDRLQSEEFVIRQRELTIIERKHADPISIEAGEIVDDAQVNARRGTVKDDAR